MDAVGTVLSFLFNLILSLYGFVLMLRIMAEWLGIDYYNPLWLFIAALTDKPLLPFQKIIPHRIKKFDLPAFVLLVLIELIKFAVFVLVDKALVLESTGMILVVGVMVWIVADLLRELINLYCYMIILFVILSWIRSRQLNPLGFIFFRLVEPLLQPARRIVPSFTHIDFSPIIVFAVLQLAKLIIVMPIFQWAWRILFGWS